MVLARDVPEFGLGVWREKLVRRLRRQDDVRVGIVGTVTFEVLDWDNLVVVDACQIPEDAELLRGEVSVSGY